MREASGIDVRRMGFEAKCELARRHMVDFCCLTKPDYQVNFHHRALCEKLDRFVAREIRRLLVFQPPRTGKSELVSRRLPAYILGKNPDTSVIACSYGASLACLMNRDVQRVIDSPAYQAIFPETKLNDKNIRTLTHGNWLRNTDIFEVVGHKGYYRSAGIGGGITGMGCEYAIIDDPIKNDEEANSATYRDKIWDWYTSTLYTRLEKDACILVTLTRWHEDDLAGRLLAATAAGDDAEQWEVVCFPAIKEGPPTDVDPREPGEPLWPEKYDLDRLKAIRQTIGAKQWTALHQQRPSPAGGSLFKAEHFRYFDVTPIDRAADSKEPEEHLLTLHVQVGDSPVVKRWMASHCRWFQTIDTALKDGEENDYTVVATWLLTPDKELLLWDVMRAKVLVPKQYDVIIQQRARWPRLSFQAVEEAASGTGIIQTGASRGTPFKILKCRGKKVERAVPLATFYENKKVFHRQGASWLPDFEDEMLSFPAGKHDDQCDAASYGAALVVTGAMQLATLDREVLGWPRYQDSYKPGDPLPERSEFAEKYLKKELPAEPAPVAAYPDDTQRAIDRAIAEMEREEEWWER